ncbi:MAG TPA: BatA domain-containing protein, partial [Acidocella sp.]|nr:BatA domain-containing protein [Acidocella sp.]
MMFVSPLALLGLAILPPLFFILRLTPPAPRRLRFPPVALLQNLPDAQKTTHRLPLWMLLLRLAAITILILGFAGPTLRPPPILPGNGPILLAIDNGWASASAWPQFINAAKTILAAARAQNRGVAILATASDPSGAAPHIQGVFAAATAMKIVSAMQPKPWPVDRIGAAKALQSAPETTRLYLADGITDGPAFQSFIKRLHPSRILSPLIMPALLAPPSLAPNGDLVVHAISNPSHAGLRAESTNGDILARVSFDHAGNAVIGLPMPIARKIAKFVLDGPATAGSTVLTDSTMHTALAGLATGSANAESPFLGTLYFLRRALPPAIKIVTGPFSRLTASKPSLIFLADTPLTQTEQTAARAFIANGGILVRFAGPLTAQAPDTLSADPLMPGDRRLGGSLTWTTPEQLAPFPKNTPFAGLPTDSKATISQQILANPTTLDPATVWATLHDGTPLILGKAIGRGYLVNILTTANTAWSNLALSGLYPAILGRLAGLAQGGSENPNLVLPLQRALNAFGVLTTPR